MRALGTGGESVGGPDYGVRVAGDALGASMIYDKRSLNHRIKADVEGESLPAVFSRHDRQRKYFPVLITK